MSYWGKKNLLRLNVEGKLTCDQAFFFFFFSRSVTLKWADGKRKGRRTGWSRVKENSVLWTQIENKAPKLQRGSKDLGQQLHISLAMLRSKKGSFLLITQISTHFAQVLILRFSWPILVKCCAHLPTSSSKTQMLFVEKNIFHKYWLFCYTFIAFTFDLCCLLSFVCHS